MLGGATPTKDSSKIVSIAEELVKAACSHVETTSLTLGKETVEGLKKLSLDSSSIEKSVGSLKASHDPKMDALAESIMDLKQEIIKLNDNFMDQTKDNKLMRAISNAATNSFKYYNKGNPNPVDSTVIFKKILFFFRQGIGAIIEDRSLTQYDGGDMEDGERQFLEALSNQIHQLTGQKPRVELKHDIGYGICYS